MKVAFCLALNKNIHVFTPNKDGDLVKIGREDILELEKVVGIENFSKVKDLAAEISFDSIHSLEGKEKEYVETKKAMLLYSNSEKKGNVEIGKPKEDKSLDNDKNILQTEKLTKSDKEKVVNESENASSRSQKPLKDNQAGEEGEISYIFSNEESIFEGYTDYKTMELCLQILNNVPDGDIKYLFEGDDIYEAWCTDEETANECLDILGNQRGMNKF